MALFDNGDPEEFLLFFINFNMTLKNSGQLVSIVNINAFVQWYVDNCYVSLTRCMLR